MSLGLSLIWLVFGWWHGVDSPGDKAHYQEFEIAVTSARITIGGTTNVNRFNCSMSLRNSGDTLNITSEFRSDTLKFAGLFLKFPISQFDCGLQVMNQDFQEFLKADEYPELLMAIDQMVINRNASLMEKVSVKSRIYINLCGKNKEYDIANAYVMELPHEEIKLACQETVRFTDFDLMPPTKFFGTIKVADELSILLDIDMHVRPI